MNEQASLLEEAMGSSDLVCYLCHMSSKPDGLKLGGLYQSGNVVAHHFCLIMSSGLAQVGMLRDEF